MKNKLTELLKDRYFQIAIILFIIGAFLRFYHIYEFTTFLGDQGRDAIILRRILTLEHLPAIGAPTSVGMVYLGPFYYYFIAPWLFLTNFDPIGPVLGVALFSSAFVIVFYLAMKELADNKIIALLAAAFVVFSAVLVEFSRFSWNPNLLPYFAFLAVYCMIAAQKTGRNLYYSAAGACLSFALQLHYLALFLVPVLGLQLLAVLFQNSQKIKNWFMHTAAFAGSFLFFSVPLLIFDLRHEFLNSKNFLKLYSQGDTVSGDKVSSIINAFSIFNLYALNLRISPVAATITLTILVIVMVFLFRKKDALAWIFLSFLALFFGVSMYSGPKYPHYFGALYVLYFAMIAGLLKFIGKEKWQGVLTLLIIGMFIAGNVRGYYFFYNNPSNQIQKAQNVAKVIFDNVKKDKYQMTGLPNKYSDSSYRYFLELWGKRSLEHDTLEKADELFVLCEQECRIIGDPQWEIAFFAPNRIVGEWEVEGLKVYKLTR